MRNFRLKLPIPDAPAGTVGEYVAPGFYRFGVMGLLYSINRILCNPEFFEEIK